MTIVEAIQATDSDKPCIGRKGWASHWPLFCYHAPKIYPTDAPGGCVLIKKQPNSKDATNELWVPTKSDLIADDWVTLSGR